MDHFGTKFFIGRVRGQKAELLEKKTMRKRKDITFSIFVLVSGVGGQRLSFLSSTASQHTTLKWALVTGIETN
jgi:hypothetical protein